jgi:hypothetical protein
MPPEYKTLREGSHPKMHLKVDYLLQLQLQVNLTLQRYHQIGYLHSHLELARDRSIIMVRHLHFLKAPQYKIHQYSEFLVHFLVELYLPHRSSFNFRHQDQSVNYL